MGDLIYLEDWKAKKLEEELLETKKQLDELIEQLDIDTTPQPYYPMSYVYPTSYSYHQSLEDNYPTKTVADSRDRVAQMLVDCAIELDGIDDKGWADFISDIAHEFMTNDTPPKIR